MDKPYARYGYVEYVCDYDRWAELCAESPEEPILMQQDARRLEHLYDDNIPYTKEQHQKNIAFLQNLLLKINYVWTWQQRNKASMGTLVDDYKFYFELGDF